MFPCSCAGRWPDRAQQWNPFVLFNVGCETGACGLFFDKSWYSGLWWVFMMSRLPVFSCRLSYLHSSPFHNCFCFLCSQTSSIQVGSPVRYSLLLGWRPELNAGSCNLTAKANLWGWKVLHSTTSRLYKSMKNYFLSFEQIPKKCELLLFFFWWQHLGCVTYYALLWGLFHLVLTTAL